MAMIVRVVTTKTVPSRSATVAAHLELTKPRITALVVFTTAAGLWLAPVTPPTSTVLLTLIGTAMVVAAANVLNMVLERDTDALMPRTMRRPLPSGRIEVRSAEWFGLLLCAISLPLLTFGVGSVPGLLASVALLSYVLVYTPLKRRTAASLLVGAVAGAIPPLIGWTAATGRFDLPGVLLFAVLFLWQVPHFLAITLFRRREYARAGLIVQANEPAGDREVRRNIVLYTVALIAVSLMFIPLGVGGTVYLVAAAISGALFLFHGLQGLRGEQGERWARNEFLGSVAYLAVVLAVLLLDHPYPG
jgi:heme o synthase